MFDKTTPAVARNNDNQTEDNAAKSIDAFNLKIDQFLMSKREQYQQFVDMSLEIKTILKKMEEECKHKKNIVYIYIYINKNIPTTENVNTQKHTARLRKDIGTVCVRSSLWSGFRRLGDWLRFGFPML